MEQNKGQGKRRYVSNGKEKLTPAKMTKPHMVMSSMSHQEDEDDQQASSSRMQPSCNKNLPRSRSGIKPGSKDLEDELKKRKLANQSSSGIPNMTIDEAFQELESQIKEQNDEDYLLMREIKDPACDPEEPIYVDQVAIWDAYSLMKRVQADIKRTPCTKSRLSEQLGMDIYFKKDFMQVTGSFKERGARYFCEKLSDEEKKLGVVTASAGNHAQALARHGKITGTSVTVVMPEQAPLVKVESCRQLGANVILHGPGFGHAKAMAMHLAHKTGAVYVNGYDHPHILAGQGSMGIEILEDVPDLDYIICPIGGGGLVAGIASAVKYLRPNVKIIGVESTRTPSWTTAIKTGKPVLCADTVTGAKQTIADGLSVPNVGVNAFHTASKLIEKVIQIDEDWIAIAILKLLETEKAVVEGAGASGLGAILTGSLPELKDKKVAVVLCGGNIDITTLGRVIERALLATGRLCRFTITVSDRPGGLAKFLNICADAGVCVKDMQHDRVLLTSFVYKTQLICTVETRGKDQEDDLKRRLEAVYDPEDITWLEFEIAEGNENDQVMLTSQEHLTTPSSPSVTQSTPPENILDSESSSSGIEENGTASGSDNSQKKVARPNSSRNSKREIGRAHV